MGIGVVNALQQRPPLPLLAPTPSRPQISRPPYPFVGAPSQYVPDCAKAWNEADLWLVPDNELARRLKRTVESVSLRRARLKIPAW
jgi:hypothetical protein